MWYPDIAQVALPQGHPNIHPGLRGGVGLLPQQHWQDQVDFHGPSQE